jgi:hypothetical protein
LVLMRGVVMMVVELKVAVSEGGQENCHETCLGEGQ